MDKKSIPVRKALLDCSNQQNLIMAHINGEPYAKNHYDLNELIRQFDIEFEILRSAISSYINDGGPALEYMYQKLEYGKPLPDFLNRFGEQGWMLAHMETSNGLYHILLVREKHE